MTHWLVQLGPFGQVGRFEPGGPIAEGRGGLAVCRTSRGLEVGRLLSEVDSPDGSAVDGQLLRSMSQQDHLLWERICRHREKAFRACEELVQRRQLPVTLMEVESLFDGNTIYFYFLGEVDERVESLTSELAETYESKVQFRRFAERLVNGCGPQCGTQQAAGGCGTGGCSNCQLSGGCSSVSAS